jgi:uncharacterized membrane protein
MSSLIVAALSFLALHVLVSGTRARDAVIARIGEKPYLGLFSLASLGAVVWISMAYGGAPVVELWPTGPGTRHAALALMLPALYLVVAGLTTPNPTVVGAVGLLARQEAVRGVLKITRHPFMWGVVLWALAHLMANGDLAALVFFGTFGLLALFGPRLIDVRMARSKGEAWTRFEAETSWLPFRAMVEKRTTLTLREVGWWRVGLGLLVYLAILFLAHEWVIGVPLLAL